MVHTIYCLNFLSVPDAVPTDCQGERGEICTGCELAHSDHAIGRNSGDQMYRCHGRSESKQEHLYPCVHMMFRCHLVG